MFCDQFVPEDLGRGVTLCKDFGLVPCGQKNVDTLKIENTSKKPRTLVLDWKKGKPEVDNGRLHVHPLQAVVFSGHPARFTLTYLSHLENIVDNFYFNVLEGEKLVSRLNVRAKSEGPYLSPPVHNIKFFCFRNVSRTVRHVNITNSAKCEAKFYFDLDEDYQHLKISQTQGVIPAGMKLGLVFTFTPARLQVYHKKIFCIVQFHQPIIFNVWGVFKPKLKVDLKQVKFRCPPEQCFPNSYAAYMERMRPVKCPEGDRCLFLSKCVEDLEKAANEAEELENVNCWTVPLDSPSDLDFPSSKDSIIAQVALTTKYLDIKNSPQVPRATALVNQTRTQVFYFEWDHDPKGHFKMEPCKGFLDPCGKADFTVLFTPSALDSLYHTEIDVRVFPCSNSENSQLLVDLPLSMSLRISGHSFPDDSCGWMPQCKINPKTLHLPSCVPDEVVHGTFMIEREGHLPVTFTVLPPTEPGYTVQPPLGYLSKNFQLFVVQFNSHSKEEGLYVEELKIKFNNSNSNYETIKLVTSVETPKVLFGSCNSLSFKPIFPRSKSWASVPIENPTNLHIRYEFVTPEDITWAEVLNPKGSIEPKSFGEVGVLFKPEMPCEYLDYIPCYLSSVSKSDRTHTTHLQLIGSSQFGYLVATPSFHDFGESFYLQEKSITIHLFNFSPSLLHFRLTTVHRAFPVGEPENDVKVTPSRGSVPAKGSLEVQVTITPHETDILQYAILCQNMEDASEEALPQEEPRAIFNFQFEGVRATMRVVDLSIYGGGPLFSSHWIWKMMNIDRLNTALCSPSLNEEITIKFPEALLGARPIIVALLLENNSKEQIRWRVKKKIFCPCLEESVINIPDSLYFCQVKLGNNLSPERKLFAHKRFISQFHVKYEASEECRTEWTLALPHGKNVKIRGQYLGLPNVTFSTYEDVCFSLRPVFIGDLHPPLQLFWLYNNTSQVASYHVNKATFRDPTANPQGVLECVNPNGTLPPFSSLPLAFLFRPREITSYSAEVVLGADEQEPMVLCLTGEGTFSCDQFKEFAIPRTIPNKAIMLQQQDSLECCQRCIDIPFFRIFSRMKRIFYLRNHSESEAWSFRWHRFEVQNIMSARVEPAEGVIKPGCTAELTLLIRSFSHPTFLSASVPCDIINYNQLQAYESSIRYRELMLEKTKDYFTITEKGISYEVPQITIKEQPQPSHIFITVNVNIVSSLNIDQKLFQQQRAALKAENEITRNNRTRNPPKSSNLPSIQLVLENLLWNVLASARVKENIKKLKASQDFNYLQILPESRKKEEERSRRFFALPSRNQLQTLLEETMREIICTKLISKKQISLKTMNEA